MNLLRQWLSRDDEPAPPAPAATGPADDLGSLRAALVDLVAMVNANGGRLPTAAIPEIREAGDRLFELLDYGDALAKAGASIDPFAMFTISAAITDYLPTSVGGYLALPASFLLNHRSADGESPAEELVSQVTTLRRGLDELAQSIYAGDSQRLTSQRRFLETKFNKSDLEL